MKTKLWTIVTLVLLIALTGCNALGGGNEVTVESVDARILESFPVQVHAAITVRAPEGCVTPGSATVVQEGSTFTIELPTGEDCTGPATETEVVVPLDVAGLSAGTYTVQVADQSTTFELEVDNVLPDEVTAEPCTPTGLNQAALTNGVAGYCLIYPDTFTVSEQPGAMVIVGPDYTEGEEPLAAFLNIQLSDAAGRTAAEIADEIVAGLEEGVEVERQETTLGGEPAVELTGVPGLNITRQVIAVRGDRAYHLTFSPLGEEYADAYADMQTLYDLVMSSFTFL